MAPITWKNIAIPDLGDNLRAMPVINDSFNKSADILRGTLTDYTKQNDANWDQGVKNNTADIVARLKGADNLGSLNALNEQYNPEALRSAFGVQYDDDKVQAAKLDSRNLLNTKAANEAFTLGNITFDSTKSEADTYAAMRKKLTDSGVDQADQFKILSDYTAGTKPVHDSLLKQYRNTNTVNILNNQDNPLTALNYKQRIQEAQNEYGPDNIDVERLTAAGMQLEERDMNNVMGSIGQTLGAGGTLSDARNMINNAPISTESKLKALQQTYSQYSQTADQKERQGIQIAIAETQSTLAHEQEIAPLVTSLAQHDKELAMYKPIADIVTIAASNPDALDTDKTIANDEDFRNLFTRDINERVLADLRADLTEMGVPKNVQTALFIDAYKNGGFANQVIGARKDFTNYIKEQVTQYKAYTELENQRNILNNEIETRNNTFKAKNIINKGNAQLDANARTSLTGDSFNTGEYFKETPPSVGERNNNPGLIQYGKFAQQMGAVGKDSKGFAIFGTLDDGAAAADRLLETYASKHGIDTVEGVINRWAPPNGEGNTPESTANYINFVSQRMGVKPKEKINLYDPAVREKLFKEGIVRFETGKEYAELQKDNPSTNTTELKNTVVKSNNTPEEDEVTKQFTKLDKEREKSKQNDNPPSSVGNSLYKYLVQDLLVNPISNEVNASITAAALHLLDEKVKNGTITEDEYKKERALLLRGNKNV